MGEMGTGYKNGISITMLEIHDGQGLARGNLPTGYGLNNCAIAKSSIRLITGVRELVDRYGANQSLSQAIELTARYPPCIRISASTPMSLCLMRTCNVLAVVVRIVLSTPDGTCSSTPSATTYSTISKTPCSTRVLLVMNPLTEDTTSETKWSAPKLLATRSLMPSTSCAPTIANVPARAASR